MRTGIHNYVFIWVNYLIYIPASTSKTFQCGTSDNRDATTEPPEPPPMIMKSYSFSGTARLYNFFFKKTRQYFLWVFITFEKCHLTLLTAFLLGTMQWAHFFNFWLMSITCHLTALKLYFSQHLSATRSIWRKKLTKNKKKLCPLHGSKQKVLPDVSNYSFQSSMERKDYTINNTFDMNIRTQNSIFVFR